MATPLNDGADRSTDPIVGTEIGGRYRIMGHLADGGMGAIYHGEHMELGRRVAVKVLSEHYATNHEAVRRFQREARATSRIDHPSIVDILDLGQLDTGEPYLVMELLEGEDLADVIAREAPMPLERVVDLLVPVANALDAVHAQGILHRDIKPANIFLTKGPDGQIRPKLLDFGLAALREAPADEKLTREGIVVGTPHYVSPEAAEGEPIDERTDVYSLAVVAFEMLSGVLPIDGDKPMTLLYAKVRKPAPTLSARTGREYDEEVERVIARTLSRTPAKRPASAGAFLQALREQAQPVSDEAPQARRGPAPATVSQQERRPSAASQGLEPPKKRPASRASEPVSLPMDHGRRWGMLALMVAMAAGLGALIWWKAAGEDPPSGSEQAQAARADEAEGEAGADEIPAAAAEPEPTEDPTPEGVEPPSRSDDDRADRRARPRRRSTLASQAGARAAEPAAAPTSPPEPTQEEPAAADQGGREPQIVEAERSPERARELAREAGTAMLRGQFPRARQLYRQATFADSEHAPAWRGLGLSSERLDMRPEAAQAYRRYLRLAPSASDAAEVQQRLRRIDEP